MRQEIRHRKHDPFHDNNILDVVNSLIAEVNAEGLEVISFDIRSNDVYLLCERQEPVRFFLVGADVQQTMLFRRLINSKYEELVSLLIGGDKSLIIESDSRIEYGGPQNRVITLNGDVVYTLAHYLGAA